MEQNATGRQGDGAQRTKKWKPDKRVMDAEERLQKGVHARARRGMETIHTA